MPLLLHLMIEHFVYFSRLASVRRWGLHQLSRSSPFGTAGLSVCCCSCYLACPEATGNLEVHKEMDVVREGAAKSLEGTLLSDRPTDAAALSMHSSRTHSKKALFSLQIFMRLHMKNVASSHKIDIFCHWTRTKIPKCLVCFLLKSTLLDLPYICESTGKESPSMLKHGHTGSARPKFSYLYKV